VSNEEVLGYIPVCKRMPLRQPYYYALFFTSKRIIVVALMDNSFATVSINWEYVRRISEYLSKLRPEQILKDHKENFEISYSDVDKIRMKHWTTTSFGKARFPVHIIEIVTKRKKFKFNICAKYHEILKSYVPMLRSVLDDRFDHKPEMIKLRYYPFSIIIKELFDL